jgi:pilus assembly protein CpaE
MAITRARLPFQVPWRHVPVEPVVWQLTAASVAPTPAPVLPAGQDPAGPSRRSAVQRGPDGRFVRAATTATAAAVEARPEPAPAVPDRTERTSDTGTGRLVTLPATPAMPALATAPQAAAAEADPGSYRVEDVSAGSRPIRIVLVEDVPEVASHVRETLRWQPRFQVIHVVADGRRAVDEVRDLHPDVVVVDALLQGRTSGRAVVEGLRAGGSSVGIVALTVPDLPVDAELSLHADAVLTLPLRTFDAGRAIVDAHSASAARDPGASSRMVAVFSGKGGVGRTTIAYNLAVSLAGTGLRTVLVDGSLQLGDVRHLLRADPAAPSISDLPTDNVRGSDLADTVLRDASGVDVLLAPRRPELAELVSERDLERLLGVLRRAYQAVVIDTPPSLNGPTLAFLDAADLVLHVVTAEPATLESARMVAATFTELGYPPAKVRYLVNRFDSAGPLHPAYVTQALGRAPDYTVANDWQLVSWCNAQGVSSVLTRPEAAFSADLRRVAADVRALAVASAEREPVRQRPRHN